MALTAYISSVRRLLHDANGKYYSDSDLTTYINTARKRIGLDTGAVKGLITYYLSASQESYPYSGSLASLSVAAAGTGYTSAPTVGFTGGGGSGATASVSISSGTISGVTITANGTGYTSAPTITLTGGGGSAATVTASILLALDVIDITVNYQNSWISLAYCTWTEFQARARYYRSITGMPALWSSGPPAGTGGGRAFYIFQIPSQSYQCDVHAIQTPAPLSSDSDPEPISYPETDLVPYYAAYLAKYDQQMFEESARFLQIYDELMRRGNAMKYQRRIPNPYDIQR